MKAKILVVDDDGDEAELLRDLLVLRGYDATVVLRPELALAALETDDVTVVVTDVRMQGMTGIELCQQIHTTRPDLPVIVMTGRADVETAVGALRAGAWDFVTKPLNSDAVVAAVGRAAAHRQLGDELLRLRKALDAYNTIDGIVGDSAAIRQLSALVARIADGDATVLITGESGTGKELVAKALHGLGPRKTEPFVAINCGAVPPTLLESELFGHVKGAFTDAKRDRAGVFVQAGSGTIFLDEIGEMPLDMQVKLLRVLQGRTVRPVGGDTEMPFAARVVCATNRDLETEIEENRFREDLYYRVNVVTLEVPPLRGRAGDVLLLAHHFLKQITARTGRDVSSISMEASRKLLDYFWPGNVRELENSMERAVALARRTEISVEDLPVKIRDYQVARIVIDTDDPEELVTLAEVERRYVRRVLDACSANRTRAAKVLGIDRRSLFRRLKGAAAEPDPV